MCPLDASGQRMQRPYHALNNDKPEQSREAAQDNREDRQDYTQCTSLVLHIAYIDLCVDSPQGLIFMDELTIHPGHAFIIVDHQPKIAVQLLHNAIIKLRRDLPRKD